MRSPKDMQVIQIDITNACHHRCSNCTRFCGHHVKPFFMDFETFKRAVDSLQGFAGVVGIIGGEPTLHPEFRRFAEYFREHFGNDDLSARMTAPTENFLDHVTHSNSYATRRGLWSSVSKQYYEHFETIQDTFSLQLLNDHNGPGTHQPLMVTRAELGIPDEEWLPLRDACWVQNMWSASITPKGAFFCEVAAAMDATLDGPGGWEIEPGWWQRTPAEFGDQLKWCELCSAPLAMPKRRATDEVDDISPRWRQMLEEIKSPKLAKGLTSLFDLSAYGTPEFATRINETPWLYLDAQTDRMGEKMRSHLKPHSLTILLELSEGVDATAAMQQLRINAPNDLNAVVLAGTDAQLAVARRAGIPCFDTREFDPREIFAQLAKSRRTEDWLLHCKDAVVTPGVTAVLADHSFNLGCLYLIMLDEPDTYAQFFNLRALSLGGEADTATLRDRYPQDKVVGVNVNTATQKSVPLPRAAPCSAARRLTLAPPEALAPA
jgi:hypothetical protein